MNYSEVVKSGLILPKKAKYTVRDVNSVIQNSLFKPYKGRTLTLVEAAFIVRCSAIYHGTDYSDALNSEITNKMLKNPSPRAIHVKRDPTYWVIIKHDGYLSFRSDSGYTGSTPYDALPGSTISQKVNAFIKQLGIKRGQYEILDENPAPRKTITRKTDATTMDTAKKYVRRKSQITKGKPSKRLVNRRIRNLQVPVGVFPNPRKRYPAPRKPAHPGAMDVAYPSLAAFRKDAKGCGYDPDELLREGYYFVEADGHVLSKKFKTNPVSPRTVKSSGKANFPYCVERKNTENWNPSGCFKTKNEAFEYAKALAVKYPDLPIRVMEYTGGKM